MLDVYSFGNSLTSILLTTIFLTYSFLAHYWHFSVSDVKKSVRCRKVKNGKRYNLAMFLLLLFGVDF